MFLISDLNDLAKVAQGTMIYRPDMGGDRVGNVSGGVCICSDPEFVKIQLNH